MDSTATRHGRDFDRSLGCHMSTLGVDFRACAENKEQHMREKFAWLCGNYAQGFGWDAREATEDALRAYYFARLPGSARDDLPIEALVIVGRAMRGERGVR